MEIESDAAKNIEAICNSRFFKSKVARLVRPLQYEDMKWVLARRYCPERYTLNFEEAHQLADYYNRVIEVLAPQEMPLLGFDQ